MRSGQANRNRGQKGSQAWIRTFNPKFFNPKFSEKADLALREAERAASLRPDIAAVHIQCGKLLAPDPSSQELRRQIGLLMQIGDDPSRKFEQYLQKEPDDAAIRLVYANLLFERKDYDQAAEQLEQAKKEWPDTPGNPKPGRTVEQTRFRAKKACAFAAAKPRP